MKTALVGIGWDAERYDDGGDFDLDVSAFLLGENGRLPTDDDIVFYNNPNGRDGAVVHMGDNLTGEGDGDNEIIVIDFAKIPDEIKKIAICVTIYNAIPRRQSFGQLSGAYIRIAKLADKFDTVGEQILKINLEQEFSTETALVAAEIYLKNGEWKFNAVAAGYQGGLEALCRSFGANI